MGTYRHRKPNKVPTEMLFEMAKDAERQVGDENLATLLRTLGAARDCDDCKDEDELMVVVTKFSIGRIAAILAQLFGGH